MIVNRHHRTEPELIILLALDSPLLPWTLRTSLGCRRGWVSGAGARRRGAIGAGRKTRTRTEEHTGTRRVRSVGVGRRTVPSSFPQEALPPGPESAGY